MGAQDVKEWRTQASRLRLPRAGEAEIRMDYQPENREKKFEGRQKRRKYVQGKRSYLHDMVSSIVKRGKQAERPEPRKDR